MQLSKLKIKIIDYIKMLELGWSELFLLIGFLFSVPFYAFAWKFMVTDDPSEIFLKDWMVIVCFVITAICWGIYFYLEHKKGNFKLNWFFWIFVLLAVLGVVTILIQPVNFETSVVVRFVNDISRQHYGDIHVGDIVEVSRYITISHQLFFTLASLVITTIYFIVFTTLPKRIKSFDFLVIVCIIIMIFIFVLTMYSYIAEHDKYIPFIQALFKGDMEELYKNTMVGFVVQRVPYGVCMLMGMLFAIIGHILTNKKVWFICGAYCLINMIFSWCKTSLVVALVVVLLYILYILIVTYKDHKKQNKIILIVYGSIVGAVAIISLVSILTQGAFIPQIYKLFSSFTDNRTIRTRTFIWDHINQQLSGGWIVLGRGFGTHNFMLYPMNLVNGDDVCPSHSTYYAVLGAGGLVQLIGFIGAYIYFGYIFYKCFKVDKLKTIALSVGVFAFFFYSFTEGINFLILVFMFPLFVYHELNRKRVDKLLYLFD